MLKVGNKAPAFSLESSDGGKLSLSDLAGRYAVIYFYPKDSTPGCTTEALAFRDARAELDALGAVVVGVSKDSIASHCKFRDKHALGFALLSDPDGSMIEKYGAWGEKKLYGRDFMGILRSTVVVGPDGRVLAHFPKVKVKEHAAEVVEVIRAAAAAAG
ncbi:MAG: thioredoxin-dependent thiol peroxidase [Sandaracinaceae bacterium]|nr:thioredoxin-dependent thiol peroxidase [Sandaracinaceae bacterium]MBP7680836.1 thioredoxin-dependent thiol peroxidase [Deltaproteobacteria bacterium]MBK6810293.1 thioredoxin-dependent thiol peroxidase [Sandaracinaceae bacterium]MBK7153664.1 thioredoxin-dependent thiol peroxidase [Sandaracinaceae bacterium]MBK7775165.1 thioredoxin-dependent thiol peroxidase [Sandaracinaceae bacterium]